MLKYKLFIRKGCIVNFKVNNSLASALGFDRKANRSGEHFGENIPKNIQVNIIMVNLDGATKLYINGAMAPVIYNFFPNNSLGVKILQMLIYLVYLQITVNAIKRMKLQ